MRGLNQMIKIFSTIMLVASGVTVVSTAAFGVTSDKNQYAAVTDVAGPMARASNDMRVRRLKQMFSSRQISADEYFVRAQSDSTQSSSRDKQFAE
jgi:hypothetical protein